MRCVALALCAFLASCDSGERDPPLPRPATYGIELSVTVRGDGRVTSDRGDIACPGSCGARLTYASASDAPHVVRLVARPEPGHRFVRWEFDTGRVPTIGLGPEECSPVRRAALRPEIDVTAAGIGLALGEVDGLSPIGRAESCAAFSRVPVVYVPTAVFAPDPDWVPPGVEVVATLPGSTVEDVAVQDGALWMRTRLPGRDQLLVQPLGGSARAVASSDQRGVRIADLSGPHVAFQDDDGVISIVDRATLEATSIGPLEPCRHLVTSATHVYCAIANGSLLSFTIRGADGRRVHTLPPAVDLAVASDGFYLLVPAADGGRRLVRAPLTGTGTTPTLAELATSIPDAHGLSLDAAHVYGVDGSFGFDRDRAGEGTVWRVPRAGGARESLVVPAAGLVTYAIAGARRVVLAAYGLAAGRQPRIDVVIDGAQSVLCDTPSSVRVMSVDGEHVYFVTRDEHVYRARVP